MLDTIHAKRDEIHSIARKHKAEKLWVFGSVARKEERPDSDIDLPVKLSPFAFAAESYGRQAGVLAEGREEVGVAGKTAAFGDVVKRQVG